MQMQCQCHDLLQVEITFSSFLLENKNKERYFKQRPNKLKGINKCESVTPKSSLTQANESLCKLYPTHQIMLKSRRVLI